MAGWVEDIRRAQVLGLVLIAGTAIEQAPSVGPRKKRHHHSCRSHATKTTFISSTTLLCLSIHLDVVP